MKYGYFDDEHREYVLTNPKTPAKWINYVGTLAFGGLVDHTGGVLICKGDPALNRITKYLPQLPASEFKGSTLYLRLRRDEGWQVFSPYFVPTLDRYDRYECHIGLGYTRIVSEFYGVRTEATFFVPVGESALIQDITITNLSGAPLEIDAIPVVEYTHFDALKQFTNADWVPQTMQSDVYDEPGGRRVLAQYAFMHQRTRINYLTSSWPVSSFESDRRRFLGDNEYGTWASPLSLQQPELSNYQARRGDNIGALLHHLGVVSPGEQRRLIVLLGQAASVEAARPTIDAYRQDAQVDAALAGMARFWDAYLGQLQVETPVASMNSMLNVHNPRQCHTTMNWSRYLSLYQLGFGARGIGVRDTSQDVMGVLASAPESARDLIRKLLMVQLRGGNAMHQFNPLTMIATEGDAREYEDRPKYYGDDHLWIVLAVTHYLKETGDFAFLDEVIPYYEKDQDDQPLESGTVFDHVQRAVAFTRHNTGAHDLPLLGFADWNDPINLPTGAESFFNAHLYGLALQELIALARHLNQSDLAERYSADYAEMRDRVNAHGWDGAWYIRYFDADGSPIGSSRNSEGQIFTNGQSWPVIAGYAPPERARRALDSVYERLNTSKGIKLSTPGYNGYDREKGGVTTYPPGAKENGGIFLHANPWVMIAETLLGNGDRAFEYYHQINPVAKNDHIDEFECEPYVYPQNILGDEHPQFGLARNSWLSGTASWSYQAGTQYILGVRPTYDGLLIDPCIPRAWDGFRVTRVFRGATYVITVHNPAHVSKGVQSVLLDGQPLAGQVISLCEDGQRHTVEVTLG
ncbi:MAG: glycosyl transferase [Chloroflexi bacterium]|nr:glycosyl transferase [Chloroflexota bacterium]